VKKRKPPSAANVKATKITCGVLIAAPFVFFIVMGTYSCVSSQISHRHQLAALKPHLNEYVNAERSDTSQKGTPPYIQGKIVMVDRGKRDFDYLVFELPASLRAAKPDQVGTVVLTEYKDNEVGTYTDGHKAYQQQVTVYLVNFATGEMYASKVFVGTDPPGSKQGGVDEYGGVPTDQVVAWLKSLPVN